MNADKRRSIAVLGFAALVLAALPGSAAEVAGVKIADTESVAPGAPPLVLNGAGLRKRLFLQVYAIGLYLPQKKASGAEAIAAPGPKRIAIHMLRDVGADQLTDSLIEGMRITLDQVAGGTQVGVEGKAAGKPIAGEDFYRALLGIWLGEKPVQDDLKRALLGGAQ